MENYFCQSIIIIIILTAAQLIGGIATIVVFVTSPFDFYTPAIGALPLFSLVADCYKQSTKETAVTTIH